MCTRAPLIPLVLSALLLGASACGSSNSSDNLGTSKVHSKFTAQDSAGALVRAQELEVLTHENLAVLSSGAHSSATANALTPYLTTRALQAFTHGDAKTISGLVPLLDPAVTFDPTGQIHRVSLSPFALESIQLANPGTVPGIGVRWEGVFTYPVISKKAHYTITVHRKMSFQMYHDTTSTPARWLLDNWVSSYSADPATPRP